MQLKGLNVSVDPKINKSSIMKDDGLNTDNSDNRSSSADLYKTAKAFIGIVRNIETL